ncbi:hypothetical protein ABH521_004250 [Staphylococcus warneri]|uniref:hypothetical protein n=1 Tax=Staphylococcus warneri TaxID=1292 RepID=UPI00325FE02D
MFVKNLKNEHLISNKTGEEINFKIDQPKVEDGKDWNDALIKHKLEISNTKGNHTTLKKESNKKEIETLDI